MQVPDGDESSADFRSEYFARQIAVKPDYILSLNASNVREDAGVTNITVIVKVRDDEEVDDDEEVVAQDTSVPLRLGTNQTGLNRSLPHRIPHTYDSEG